MTPTTATPDHDTRYCGGPKRQGEGTCTRPAGWGTPHPGVGRCKLHGGSTPSHVAAARKVQAERALMAIWNPNAEPLTDSVAEMQRLAGSLRQAVDVLGGALNTGEECEACGRGNIDLDSAHAIAWVRTLRELRQLLGEMERLGLANRFVELKQAEAEFISAAFRAAIDTAGGSLVPAVRAAMVEVFLARLEGSKPGTMTVEQIEEES